MKHDRAARPNSIPWPPLLYAGCAAGAWLLGRATPLPDWLALGGFAAGGLLGWALLVAGLALDLWAMATMMRHRANILPHRAATALVTHGPFALSRNPIYLGNTCLLLGIGFATGNAWFIPAALLAAALVAHLAITREEQHLNARFGAAWREYAARTPRWVGRPR